MHKLVLKRMAELRDEMQTHIRRTCPERGSTVARTRGMELIVPVSRPRSGENVEEGISCILYSVTRIYSTLVPERGTRSYHPVSDTATYI